MHLLPTQDEVVQVLRDTGALRDGHFEYPSGLHSNEYLQVPLAMRYYQHTRTLSVGLSRLLRANPEIRAIIPELSVVAPATGGLTLRACSMPGSLTPTAHFPVPSTFGGMSKRCGEVPTIFRS